MLRKTIDRYYLLLLFVCLLPVAIHRTAINVRAVIWSDCEGYYKYLPTLFIIGDFHKMPEGSVWPLRNEQGEILNKYSCGVAYFEAPFFLIARAYSLHFTTHSEDVFNNDYARSVMLSGFCAGFLGLFFLQRALRRKYPEKVVRWTLLAVFAGTNLFHYTTREMGMAHVYAFCLMAFLADRVPRFYERPGAWQALMLGAATGWLALIRPTDALALIFIVFYEIYSATDALKRFRFWRKNFPLLVLAALAGLLFWAPQMWYWHEMTGSWLHYSYTDEHFIYWKSPKIAAVLFDPQNGLFLYSPMVLVMVAGMLLDVVRKRNSGPAIAAIFGLSTYLFASWWAWWFGGAFGARSYVEWYALLALSLAGLFDRMEEVPYKALKYGWYALVLFLVYYSVRLSFLYNLLPGPWDGAECRWNWHKMVWIWQHLCINRH